MEPNPEYDGDRNGYYQGINLDKYDAELAYSRTRWIDVESNIVEKWNTREIPTKFKNINSRYKSSFQKGYDRGKEDRAIIETALENRFGSISLIYHEYLSEFLRNLTDYKYNFVTIGKKWNELIYKTLFIKGYDESNLIEHEDLKALMDNARYQRAIEQIKLRGYLQKNREMYFAALKLESNLLNTRQLKRDKQISSEESKSRTNNFIQGVNELINKLN